MQPVEAWAGCKDSAVAEVVAQRVAVAHTVGSAEPVVVVVVAVAGSAVVVVVVAVAGVPSKVVGA